MLVSENVGSKISITTVRTRLVISTAQINNHVVNIRTINSRMTNFKVFRMCRNLTYIRQAIFSYIRVLTYKTLHLIEVLINDKINYYTLHLRNTALLVDNLFSERLNAQATVNTVVLSQYN